MRDNEKDKEIYKEKEIDKNIHLTNIILILQVQLELLAPISDHQLDINICILRILLNIIITANKNSYREKVLEH